MTEAFDSEAVFSSRDLDWQAFGLADHAGSLFETSDAATIAKELREVVIKILTFRHLKGDRTRARLITHATIEAYIARAEAMPSDVQSRLVIDYCVDLAHFIGDSRDPETVIDLEVLTENLKPWQDISPVGLAAQVKETHGFHPATRIAEIATQFWLLHQIPHDHAQQLTTSHFDSLRREFDTTPQPPTRGYHTTDYGLYR